MRWLLANRLRPYVLLAAAASLLLNLALLIPSIYMLQIFDRVFASRSQETLLMLSLLALLSLVLGYFVDSMRAESLGWAGRALDRFLSPRALASSLQYAAANTGKSDSGSLRDIASLRGFLSSNGVLALFDAPWLPVYLLVIAAMNPLLGITATTGAVLLATVAVVTEKLTRTQTMAAHSSARQPQNSRRSPRVTRK
jgi:ABC-type protease/lipase transport system fused ATPase/permease subunit